MAKGTALFGGIQLFTILINLIRGKFVALLLGPEGMGISSILTSSMNTLQQFTSLGLNLSIVKEISESRETENKERICQVASIARILLKCTAILGALITVLFSIPLSVLSFGNPEYKWYFILLSAVVFFTTLSNGEMALLQAIREIRKLAYASIIGALTGLVVGIPLYYFLGYAGIVPAMIVLSMASYGFYRYSSRRLFDKRWGSSCYHFAPLLKQMISLGLVLMIASLLGTGANYALNTYISRCGSLEDVGLYQAANSITNQYVGIVFTAMSLDYLPRLSAITADTEKLNDVVNKQMEIVMFIVAPLSILLILAAPLVVRMLLSDQFLVIIPLLRWMALGLFLKAMAYPMGYISFSKGDRKTFFWLEGVGGNLLTLIMGILTYSLYGLIGLGISLCIIYLLGCILYIVITSKLYHFRLNKKIYEIAGVLVLFILICFSGSRLSNMAWSYVMMGGASVSCLLYCFFELNKRLGLVAKFKNR